MNSQKDLLKKTDELISKIRRLSEKYEKLLADIRVKDEKIEAMKKIQVTNEERIQMLEHEVASLKLGVFIEFSEEDKKEMRRKLNEYLKEIDGVIGKLEGEG